MTDRGGTPKLPLGLYLGTRFVAGTARYWERIGNLESAVLRQSLEQIDILRPIYITALPRSGTTIITEVLNRHPDTTSHRYGDFPFVYTPYWRNWLHDRARLVQPRPVERFHRDRLMVTVDSPEAVEETIWMHFFPDLHNPAASNILGADERNPRFEAFYGDHIRKLLLVRGRRRYLAKGNYNITRLGYLLRLYPDARFIVPVRHPEGHVASLIRQDRLFREAALDDPRITRQLAASGHFEFGPLRRCVNWGDASWVREIESLWHQGREALAWARYWAGLYGFVQGQIRNDPVVARATLVIRYEDLCTEPVATMRRMRDHCGLDADGFSQVEAEFSNLLSLPGYYQPVLSETDRDDIVLAASGVAGDFGYEL